MCGKDELGLLFKEAYQLDDILKNSLVVEVVFWLVNQYNIIVMLA